MNVLAWILFGLITGIVANSLDTEESENTVIKSTLLGIGGAVIGGGLAHLIFGMGVSGFNLLSFSVAIAGSIMLLISTRAFSR